jgi:thioredoxin reductase (NADPH)
MPPDPDTFDLVIVGAGPIGIACGVEAVRAGLSHLLIEKGCLTSALYRFPSNVVFFSTANLLEIGDVPLVVAGAKPSRRELLIYYRRVAEHYRLSVRLYERVLDVAASGGGFEVRSDRARYRARQVVLANGFYDHPKLLGVPGEELPKVSHYYTEPYPYYRQRVAVVGAQNSAVEAALDLHRNGVQDLTLIHRGPGLGSAIKYWVRPDIENRIREGSIRALFDTDVVRIEESSIVLRRRLPGGDRIETLENDFVLAMTGYRSDLEFLVRLGIRLEGEKRRPVFDPETMETNVPGLFVAGVAAGGLDTNRIFIENGRVHAKVIASTIAGRGRRPPATDGGGELARDLTRDIAPPGAKETTMKTSQDLQPLYDPEAVKPLRQELTRVGVRELLTVEDVDAVLGETPGTALVVINSICGCAAGGLRPGVMAALQHRVIPDVLATVFAGMERAATERVRHHIIGYPPSSPSAALFKDGKVVFMLQRREIEGRQPQDIAAALARAFDEHCKRPGPSIPRSEYEKIVPVKLCGSSIPQLGEARR